MELPRMLGRIQSWKQEGTGAGQPLVQGPGQFRAPHPRFLQTHTIQQNLP